MDFPSPLIPGLLQRRYKRFLADVTLDNGETVVAHCANPGSMSGLAEPGSRVWLSESDNPKRKLRYTWEIASAGGEPVGINTGHPNAIVAESIRNGRIPELEGYGRLKREVRYGRNSRIDILLEAADGGGPSGTDRRAPCYVEVKSVTLKRDETDAEFPDAVTSRGAKHLEELGDAVEAGCRAVMFFLVQRADCARMSIAGDIDPNYETAFRRAAARGVEVICYDCRIAPQGIELNRPLPLAV